MFKRTVLCGFVLLLILSCFANAQTCKIGTPFDAAPCTDCKTCTGLGSGASCCNAVMDTSIAGTIALSQVFGATAECGNFLKKYSCAICDPKNQLYVKFESGKYNVAMCKSACLEMKTACPGSTTDCTALPDTNCWSAANSLNQGVAVMFILSILAALFF